MFVLFCASMGRIAVQQYWKGGTVAPEARNWDKELTAYLPVSQKGQTYTYQGQSFLCDTTINKDHTGECDITLKDGTVMRIPFTMTVIGNAVHYHYNHQGREWDWDTTVEKLIALGKSGNHNIPD
jgi:hypothetical protein